MRTHAQTTLLLIVLLIVGFFACLVFGGLAVLLARRSTAPVRTPLVFPSPLSSTTTPFQPGLSPVSPASPSPFSTNLPALGGKIVYVCQVFRVSSADQICIMDADGSNQRRITTSNKNKHYYPALAPDGLSVVFSANLAGPGKYDIYEMDLVGGSPLPLTQELGILTSPDISPDGSQIVFANGDGKESIRIWLMNRDGSNPRQVYHDGWDPSWSPDGSLILFATNRPGYGPQLATIRPDGTDFQLLTDVRDLRGRSDWSNDNRWLITYLGKPWMRELYIMNIDGSDPHRISPSGGNSQGPSFSPDGQWVVFTGYFDLYGDDHGCEIYKMRVDGSSLARLTTNDYCDWQPRWGP